LTPILHRQRLEDHRELQHGEQALRPACQPDQFDVALPLANGLRLRHKHPDARAVDVLDAGEIHDQPDLTPLDQLVDFLSECEVAIVDRDISGKNQDRQVAGLVFGYLEAGCFRCRQGTRL